jgi:hypothetical protein
VPLPSVRAIHRSRRYLLVAESACVTTYTTLPPSGASATSDAVRMWYRSSGTSGRRAWAVAALVAANTAAAMAMAVRSRCIVGLGARGSVGVCGTLRRGRCGGKAGGGLAGRGTGGGAPGAEAPGWSHGKTAEAVSRTRHRGPACAAPGAAQRGTRAATRGCPYEIRANGGHERTAPIPRKRPSPAVGGGAARTSGEGALPPSPRQFWGRGMRRGATLGVGAS